MTLKRRCRGEPQVTLHSSRVDEDPFEKQIHLTYESQTRVSTAQRYGMPQAPGQLQEWITEKPIPYIS